MAIHQNTTSFSAHVSTQLPSPLILLLIGVVRDDHNILPIIITFGLLGSSVYSLLRAGWVTLEVVEIYARHLGLSILSQTVLSAH